ncbi:hypothetical protein ABZ135_38740 [Streptomyces sp. NPDC006339]|uniref:hypothetical protein n=1 Tax=Streptomyces sp. NPDC006339 TaxID=3156755 RepID=UPI0033BEE24B
MDTFEPVTGDYPNEERLPLLLLSEAEEIIRLLRLLENHVSPETAFAAGQMIGVLASRLPARGE